MDAIEESYNNDPYNIDKVRQELIKVLNSEQEKEIKAKNNIINLQKIIKAIEGIQ